METALTPNTHLASGVEKFFKDRKMIVCSMHGKDLVMRQLIERYLHLDAEGVHGLNTDKFGMFSGETHVTASTSVENVGSEAVSLLVGLSSCEEIASVVPPSQ